MTDFNGNVPEHIGIIMDGNGRWAKKRLMPRSLGHRQGAKVFKNIVEYCRSIGVKYVTAYAFSTENWKRPEEEVNAIIKLLKEYLKNAFDYNEKRIKVKFLGDISVLDDEIKRLIAEIEEISKDEAETMTLNIAFNYGGRREIASAVKVIAEKVKNNEINCDDINEDLISQYLYTSGQPDPDFILRPSGEYRLSNFLVWQSAYSELIFMDVLWPDFKSTDMDEAILEFNKRNRRYGGL